MTNWLASMSARAFRGARTWVQVTADIADAREDRLTHLAETMAEARAIPLVSVSEESTNDA
jgi:hypothetical protein